MNDTRQYLETRVAPRLAWYDEHAQRAKRVHLTLQYAAIAGSLGLVLLLHVETVPRLVLAFVATLVTLAVAVERVGKFGELWMTYRIAAEVLASEIELFRNRAGPYANETDPSQRLVERVEGLLSKEAMTWVRMVENRTSTGVLGE